MYADDHEELSRQSLVAQAVAINGMGRGYFRAAGSAERAAAARQRFYDLHGAVERVSLIKVVEYATFAFALFCIYVIDVLLFGASAEYIAGLLGSQSKVWASVAKFVVPACFLGVEVLIALQIEKSRQDVRFAFGSDAAKKGWIALGVLVALVMPLAAKATADSAAILAGSSTPVMMMTVLGIVSFTAHVLVLFGGRLAQDTKTYFAFAIVRTFYDARATSTAQNAARTLAVVNSIFIAYVHAWRRHNARFSYQPSGPFDSEVVELLRRQFPHVPTGASAAVFAHSEEPS